MKSNLEIGDRIIPTAFRNNIFDLFYRTALFLGTFFSNSHHNQLQIIIILKFIIEPLNFFSGYHLAEQ